MCICMYIYIHKCIFLSLSLYIYIFIHIHVCVYIYIYIYIHIHIHIHIVIVTIPLQEAAFRAALEEDLRAVVLVNVSAFGNLDLNTFARNDVISKFPKAEPFSECGTGHSFLPCSSATILGTTLLYAHPPTHPLIHANSIHPHTHTAIVQIASPESWRNGPQTFGRAPPRTARGRRPTPSPGGRRRRPGGQ